MGSKGVSGVCTSGVPPCCSVIGSHVFTEEKAEGRCRYQEIQLAL